MRTSDIVIGGTYAADRYGLTYMVRVEDVKVDRVVEDGGRSFSTHTNQDGILVTVLTDSGADATRTRRVLAPQRDKFAPGFVGAQAEDTEETTVITEIVTARQILRTWDEHVVIAEHQRTRQAQQDNRRLENEETFANVRETIEALLDKPASSMFLAAHGTVHINVDVLADALAQALNG